MLASALGAEDGFLSMRSRTLVTGHQDVPFVSVNCLFRIGSFGVVFRVAPLLLESGMFAARLLVMAVSCPWRSRYLGVGHQSEPFVSVNMCDVINRS